MTKRRRALPLGKTDWGIVTKGCKITARLEKAVPGGFPCWEDAEHGRGCGLLHATVQWWSSSPQGLVGVRPLPGSKGNCAWKNMWVCKEKIHRWLVKAEGPLSHHRL